MFKKVLSIYLACGLGVMIARWTDPEAKEQYKQIHALADYEYSYMNKSARDVLFATATALASFGCIMGWPLIVVRTWTD